MKRTLLIARREYVAYAKTVLKLLRFFRFLHVRTNHEEIHNNEHSSPH